MGSEFVKPRNKNKILNIIEKKKMENIITVEETYNDTSDHFLHVDKPSPSSPWWRWHTNAEDNATLQGYVRFKGINQFDSVQTILD